MAESVLFSQIAPTVFNKIMSPSPVAGPLIELVFTGNCKVTKGRV
ncbi:MAG: hypothetical protein BWY75_02759 [bacterium ADurb.Bin425]|nr:MAG: hypothetical protein BWY75_02759 [bacterium ADurb.Bin425]